jgi:hypothetical protein
MASRTKAVTNGSGRAVGRKAQSAEASSLAHAERGVQSSADFRNLMSALMTDVIRGSLSPEVTNAACNAGGKILKMVEMEYKFATNPERRNSSMQMAGSLPASVDI